MRIYTLRRTTILAVLLALALVVLLGGLTKFGGKPAGAETVGPDVQPKLIDGNPDCTTGGPEGIGLGYDHGFKIEGENLANQSYTSPDGYLTVTISNLQFAGSEKVKFDWASNVGVDAVIVKSQDANAFVYDPPGPERLGDDGLYSPQNKNISHVDFCYDVELKVEKTANTSLTRTHTWTIDKSADKDADTKKVTLPVGGTSPVNYSVKVDETPKDSDRQVDGTITVTAPVDATVTGVTDVISGGITDTNVNCPGTFPVDLTAGQSLTCTYSADLPDATTRTNTATATSGTTDVNDGTGQASVNFANATVNEIDEQIDVSDSLQGSLGTATADRTFTYTRNVGSYEQCGNYEVPNTASFTTNDTKTTGEDSWKVAVTVLCNVKVVKTVSGKAPTGEQAFTFELRQGASTTQPGNTLETKVANAANGGVFNFTSGLVPGSTYQICEQVMPGWSTNLPGDGQLFVPESMTNSSPPLPNPNVNNMTVCADFTVGAGPTRTFNVDNTPPPGGRALTIGFWKNWASCASSAGKGPKPMLDLALGKASSTTTNPPGGLVVSADTSGSPPTLWPNYTATWSLVLKGNPASTNTNIKPAIDCSRAVNLLNKSTTDGKKKMASDPLFNMTAQLVAAQLNRFMGAGINGTTIQNIDRAVLLNGKYNFDGLTYSPKLTTADTNLANCLATQLDNYNNDRLVSSCP